MSRHLLLEKHKLIYHPEALAKFMKGEVFAPIQVELSPSARCNHNCHHCYTRYVMNKENSPPLLEKDLFFKIIRDCADFGVKAISFCGTGEPMVNPHTPEAIVLSKKLGVDAGLISNGALATQEKIEPCLSSLMFIRFSFSGNTPEIYAKNQGASEEDFYNVIKNLEDIVKLRDKQKLDTTIGVAFHYFQNCDSREIVSFSKRIKETGVDYLQIKPSGDFKKNNYEYEKHAYRKVLEELEEASTLTDDNFLCQIKIASFERLEQIAETHFALPKKCWGLLFFTNIGSDGKVYSCAGSWYEEKDCYGSLKDHTLEEIWKSDRFKKIFNRRICTHPDLCFTQCHNIPMNEFLMDLKAPPEHINFI